MRPTTSIQKKKTPAGKRPRDGRIEVTDGGCVPHPVDDRNVAAAVLQQRRGDGHEHIRQRER
jgi:hypothetical protein